MRKAKTTTVTVERRLLKPVEAAELLRVGRSKVYELIAAGHIKAVTIGERGKRIPVQSIDDYLAAQGR